MFRYLENNLYTSMTYDYLGGFTLATRVKFENLNEKYTQLFKKETLYFQGLCYTFVYIFQGFL